MNGIFHGGILEGFSFRAAFGRPSCCHPTADLGLPDVSHLDRVVDALRLQADGKGPGQNQKLL